MAIVLILLLLHKVLIVGADLSISQLWKFNLQVNTSILRKINKIRFKKIIKKQDRVFSSNPPPPPAFLPIPLPDKCDHSDYNHMFAQERLLAFLER